MRIKVNVKMVNLVNLDILKQHVGNLANMDLVMSKTDVNTDTPVGSVLNGKAMVNVSEVLVVDTDILGSTERPIF